MSFEQLVHVSEIGHDKFPFHLLVNEWREKRQHLAVWLNEIPRLIADYKASRKTPYDQNPRITLVDPVPGIRLSSACEAAANCLYAMAEISAQFGNKASKGALPSSFNALRKKAEKGEYSNDFLAGWTQDLSWYKKIREIRTEWAHFSTIFIGQANDEPIICVRCFRNHSDRTEFPKHFQIPIPEFLDWLNRAIATIDNFGNYVLANYVVPAFDLNEKLISPKRDRNGWPIINAAGGFEIEEITVEQHLAKVGIHKTR